MKIINAEVTQPSAVRLASSGYYAAASVHPTDTRNFFIFTTNATYYEYNQHYY